MPFRVANRIVDAVYIMFTARTLLELPNLLSLSRILLIIPIVWLYGEYHQTGESVYHTSVIILVIVAALTDYFDGYAARHNDQISEVGKILDPVADKTAIAAIAILLNVYNDLPLWIVIVVLGRDLLILIGSLFMMRKIKSIPSSEWPGKITVFILSVLFFSYLLEWTAYIDLLLIITIFSIAYSFLDYVLKFIRLTQGSK